MYLLAGGRGEGGEGGGGGEGQGPWMRRSKG